MAISSKYAPLVARNVVNKALDFGFVDAVIQDVVKKHFPSAATMTKLEHTVYKRRVGKQHSTFIYGYTVHGKSTTGIATSTHLIYSAHSDGSRKRAYTNLRMLLDAGFNDGRYDVIVPLEYRDDIKCMIYESVQGKNLLAYMQQRTPLSDLKQIIRTAAQWISKFHKFHLDSGRLARLPTFTPLNFNIDLDELLKLLREDSAFQAKKLEDFLQAFTKLFGTASARLRPQLVYGDLHPENIITPDPRADRLTMIDFVDVSLGDQLRDIGTFVQQLQFMGRGFYDAASVDKLRITFLEEYFQQPFEKVDTHSLQRINLYQAWNAVRGFVWFFLPLRSKAESYGMLEDAWLYLTLAQEESRHIMIYHGT